MHFLRRISMSLLVSALALTAYAQKTDAKNESRWIVIQLNKLTTHNITGANHLQTNEFKSRFKLDGCILSMKMIINNADSLSNLSMRWKLDELKNVSVKKETDSFALILDAPASTSVEVSGLPNMLSADSTNNKSLTNNSLIKLLTDDEGLVNQLVSKLKSVASECRKK